MRPEDEKREATRYPHDAAIVYAYHNTDTFFQAKMCNFCKSGMCFESSYAVVPGSDIYIMMENFSSDKIGSEIYDGYLAEVRWCQASAGVDPILYKIGVKYYQTLIGQSLDKDTQ